MINKKKVFRLLPTQILVIGFAIVILIGSILLALPIASATGESIGMLNALFEATSAVCVTGLIVVDTATELTLFGQIVIMILIQIGGLGFMTMATVIFLLLGKRITLKERLVMQEALNRFSLEGIVRLTKKIIYLTMLIESLGALIMSIRFIPMFGWTKGIYYSIFHAISAFCNAGFDLMGNYSSLTDFVYDPLINLVISGLIIFGGLGFSVIFDIFSKYNYKKWSLHSRLAVSMTIALIFIGMLFFLAVEHNNPQTLGKLDREGKVLASFFQSVTSRTAGFNTIDQAGLEDTSKFMTILLMFIGASPASTGGGIKTVTAVVIFLMTVSVIKGKEDIEVSNKRIAKDIGDRALAIMFINTSILIGGTMILSIIEPYPFIDIMFEIGSALGTVGLASFDNASLRAISKVIVIIVMFAGRVGPLTLTSAIAKRQSKSFGEMKYPEVRVMIG